jgi:hypothetical protein
MSSGLRKYTQSDDEGVEESPTGDLAPAYLLPSMEIFEPTFC